MAALSQKASHKLNLALATEIMGWNTAQNDDLIEKPPFIYIESKQIWLYANSRVVRWDPVNNLDQAMTIVDHLISDGFKIEIILAGAERRVVISLNNPSHRFFGVGFTRTTLSLAICKAVRDAFRLEV